MVSSMRAVSSETRAGELQTSTSPTRARDKSNTTPRAENTSEKGSGCFVSHPSKANSLSREACRWSLNTSSSMIGKSSTYCPAATPRPEVMIVQIPRATRQKFAKELAAPKASTVCL